MFTHVFDIMFAFVLSCSPCSLRITLNNALNEAKTPSFEFAVIMGRNFGPTNFPIHLLLPKNGSKKRFQISMKATKWIRSKTKKSGKPIRKPLFGAYFRRSFPAERKEIGKEKSPKSTRPWSIFKLLGARRESRTRMDFSERF